MAEIVELLFHAIFAAVMAFVNAVIALLQLVLDVLGISLQLVAETPAEGRSRLHPLHLLVAVVPIGLLGAGGWAAVSLGVPWLQHRQQVAAQNRATTQAQVTALADQLAAEVPEAGGFAPLPPGLVIPIDPWGLPLNVQVDDKVGHFLLSVHSAGPDNELRTHDDLTANRRRLKGELDVAKDVAGSMWEMWEVRDKQNAASP